MKTTFIKLYMLACRVNLFNTLCIICITGLMLLHLPLLGLKETAKNEREGFPERRQGGGTHWSALGMRELGVKYNTYFSKCQIIEQLSPIAPFGK